MSRFKELFCCVLIQIIIINTLSEAKSVGFRGEAQADVDNGVINIGLDLRNILKQSYA